METRVIELFLENPFFLWFLLLIPLFLLLGYFTRYEIKGKRKGLSIFLRVAMALLLVLALAGLEARIENDQTAVVYVLDLSESIQKEQLEEAVQFIQESQKEARPQDQMALVGFASEANLILPFQNRDDFQIDVKKLNQIRTTMERTQSDLASALAFARALFPRGYKKGIVLLSDGQQTMGEAHKEAELAENDGIEISVKGLELSPSKKLEVKILKVTLTHEQARLGEAVGGKVFIQSNRDKVKAKLRIYKNNLLLEERKVELNKGLNDPARFGFRDTLTEKGMNLYRAEIIQEKDENKKNNKAHAMVYAHSDRLRVMIVEKKEIEANPLIEALAKENIRGEWMPPKGLGPNIYNYDAIVLSDVPVTMLQNQSYNSDEIMAMIQDYVRQGGGFVMIGGPDSFGLGGYVDTDIEKILPVEMDIPQKSEQLPVVAIGLVVDKSGSMASMGKISLAREASVKVVELLKPQDYIGVVGFDSREYWYQNFRQATNKTQIIENIRSIGAAGGTNIYPALNQSYQKLSRLSAAKIKHIILLTDGRTQGGNYQSLCEKIRSAGITLSTVAVGRGSDVNLLRNMAKWGKGRFYYTENINNIPRIFTQEAIKASKSTVIDEPFRAQVGIPAQFLEGIDWKTSPELLSYVITHPKKTALVSLLAPSSDAPEGRPLLATWQVGLGKTAAFTSDAKNRWAAMWLDWGGYAKFWAQLLRYVGKKKVNSLFQLSIEEKGKRVEFKVDAANPQHEFLNKKDFKLSIYRFKRGRRDQKPEREDIDLTQVAPGRYGTEIEGLEQGFYAAVLREKGKKIELQSAGFSITDHLEYLQTGLHGELLQKVASKSQLTSKAEEVWSREEGEKAFNRQLLWPFLLMLALIFLPLDIAVRRLKWGSGTQKLPPLPMRPLEIAIRTTAAIVAFAASIAGVYWLGERYLDPLIWVQIQNYYFSLAAVGLALVTAPLATWLGWRFSLRKQMF